jgi:hypothetical protein
MTVHSISASTSVHGSPIGTGARFVQLVFAPGTSWYASPASTAKIIADGSGPSGPVRPASGLVYPVCL